MTRKTTDNPVLKAMIGIEELLEELTDQGKAQVLRWANDEYGHVLAGGRPQREPWNRPVSFDVSDAEQDGRAVEAHP
jgi:hypothetical protein